MGFSFNCDSNNIVYISLFFICRFWIWLLAILIYFCGITWVFTESSVIRISFHCFGIVFFQNMQFRYPVLLVSLIWLYFFYSEIRPYSSKILLIKIIPLFIQLNFTKHLHLNFIYLFLHIKCFLISLKFCVL